MNRTLIAGQWSVVSGQLDVGNDQLRAHASNRSAGPRHAISASSGGWQPLISFRGHRASVSILLWSGLLIGGRQVVLVLLFDALQSSVVDTKVRV